MATNVDDTTKKLRPLQRKNVETRAAALIAEEMTLRELRHARKLTQVRKAKKLGITQDSVASRTAKRSLSVHAQKDHRSPQADDTRWRNRRLLNAVMLESEQLVRRGTVGFIPRNPPDQMVGS